jgi:UDP-N-acetylglucosamine--N-acetylmuramyl-(pentapeptide) pyrophosphoryl-undecaprenol N-acetylglucosamine transferase
MAVAQRPLVRHQCGAKHLEETRRGYAEAGVDAQVDEFIDDMASAYAWADLVVCRAGALTLAELCAVGVASILVPFPAAVDDHQTHNAAALVAHGAARLVAEGDRFADRLAAALNELLDGDAAKCRSRLLTMANAARALARPDAAVRIADACLEAAA